MRRNFKFLNVLLISALLFAGFSPVVALADPTPSPGDDNIIGTENDDDISSLAGDDFVYGRGGNDTLNGNAGDDYLYGEEGDDTLSGGNGTDYLFGGNGTDTVHQNVDNDQTLTNSSLTGRGNDTLDSIENALLSGGASDNEINASAFTGTVTLKGFGGNDILTGGENDDELYGGDGNDQIYGNGGNDLLFGSDGEDYIEGGAGDDHLGGGADNDELHGGEGNDVILGHSGDDELYGEDGNDLLDGGQGNDTLYGNDGYDDLFGGAGNDILDGGDGDDFFFGEQGSDTIIGGNGFDVVFQQTDNNQVLTDTQLTGQGTDSLESIEGADLTGGDGDNRIDARTFSGEVHLYGEAGNDTLLGGLGDDLLVGGSGDDDIRGYDGDDDLFGGEGDDTLRGGEGADWLFGEEGNDTLYGNNGDDDLYGGEGDDILRGGDGDDFLFGEEGNDTIRGGDGFDVVFQQTDNDQILTNTQLTGQGTDSLNSIEGADLTGGIGDNFIDASLFRGEVHIYGEAGNDTLLGGSGDDYIVGGFGNDTIDGNAGNDLLNGGFGDDTLNGNAGSDLLLGGLGVDTLNGGGGDDELYGGLGDDTLSGGGGDDELYGGFGDDTLSGGSGDDKLYGGFGDDTLNGNSGDDLLFGSFGNDTLNGGNDDDILLGFYGDDRLRGGNGDDILAGGEGDDILNGNNGNDTIYSNGGDDTVRGGEGDDTIIFSATDINTDVTAFGNEGENVFRFASGTQGHYTLNTESGQDTLDFSQYDQGVTVDLSDTNEQEVSSGLWLTLSGFFKNLVGTNQNDVLVGNDLDNDIRALNGNDQLDGNGGVNYLHGGPGIDEELNPNPDNTRISIELPANPETAPTPDPFAFGPAGIIPVTGGQIQKLQCRAGSNEITLKLESGDQVRFIGLCDLDASLDKLGESAMPAELPNEATFVSDMLIQVLDKGTLLKLFESGSIEISFVVPSDAQGKDLALLFWDEDLSAWVEIPLDSKDLQYPANLNPHDKSDLRLIYKGLSSTLLQAISQENFSGLFVLVAK